MKTPEAICVACRPAIEALKTGRPAPWELNYVDVAPHHDCFIHAHLVGASPAGRIVESFPEPERDPLPAELFENPPRIADGWLTLNGAPGLGLSLSPSAMRKFGQLVFAAVAKAGLDDPPPLLFPQCYCRYLNLARPRTASPGPLQGSRRGDRCRVAHRSECC